MVPRFNGGAFSPVTPNNGNPNTVYNTSVPGEPVQPPVPQFRPMASYGGAFQTPQVIDSNADTRSPRAITLQRETAPPPTVRPTSLGVNTDFWRNRLSQSLTGLEPITIPGITPPVQPVTPVPQPQPGFPTKPIVSETPVPDPYQPVVPRLPQEVERMYGIDPVFSTGQFGLGAGLGMANRVDLGASFFPGNVERAREVDQYIAQTYPLMDDAQRAEVDELRDPATPPERRRSLLQRLARSLSGVFQGIGNYLDEQLDYAAANPLETLGNVVFPGLGNLLTTPVDPVRQQDIDMLGEGGVRIGPLINSGDNRRARTSPR